MENNLMYIIILAIVLAISVAVNVWYWWTWPVDNKKPVVVTNPTY